MFWYGRYLFSVLVKLNENICFHCDRKIDTPEEFTIEHKTKHQNDPDLFWDLNNVACSHFICNVSNGPKGKQWITNGIDSALVDISRNIPSGWYKGRKQKIFSSNGELVLMTGINHPNYKKSSICDNRKRVNGRFI